MTTIIDQHYWTRRAAKAREIMAAVDRYPAPIRRLIHEYGLKEVSDLWFFDGLRDPDEIERRINLRRRGTDKPDVLIAHDFPLELRARVARRFTCEGRLPRVRR